MDKQFYCHLDRIALDCAHAALHMGAGHDVEAVEVMLEDKFDPFVSDSMLEGMMTERFARGMKA